MSEPDPLHIYVIVLSLLGLVACSTTKKSETSDSAALKAQLSDVRVSLYATQNRMENLDAKIASLNDKQEQTRVSLASEVARRRPEPTPALAHPSSSAGLDVDASDSPAEAANDPETGFIHDSSISSFRQAKVLYQTRKYPEAALAFSAFVEKYADHTLAAMAQFYTAESYFKEKEYQLAVQEFQKLLTSYGQSSQVAETLRDMAIAEDSLNQHTEAEKHRRLLLALFPKSPAAQ